MVFVDVCITVHVGAGAGPRGGGGRRAGGSVGRGPRAVGGHVRAVPAAGGPRRQRAGRPAGARRAAVRG